ncbi:hypothetical protein [Rhodohalobacter sp. 614A]|uniref:hypothetical protein n=1 Tax=Rhodohalobacter sp. 614A TaxID=2908649 RepID=UPI001F3EFAEA|nr:hypothetical protein [Rhodohalobacter sp. 614A]
MIRGEKLEDIAWDFIADIFEKNEKGELIKLKEYFCDKDIATFTEKKIRIELRKLIFTKVEDNIFRSLGKRDPSLRKIIRNLKLALKEKSCHHSIMYHDGRIIVEEKEIQNQPAMPSEFMQMKLCSRLHEKMQIPDILDEVIEVLICQDRYRKEFPLVALASIIREAYVHLNESLAESSKLPNVEEDMFQSDFENFLDESVQKTKKKTGVSYVEKGKLDSEELDLYMVAAQDIVRDHFTDGRKEFSQYEWLKNYLPHLDHEDYRNNKRQYLEYIVNQIKKDLVSSFKDDWL